MSGNRNDGEQQSISGSCATVTRRSSRVRKNVVDPAALRAFEQTTKSRSCRKRKQPEERCQNTEAQARKASRNQYGGRDCREVEVENEENQNPNEEQVAAAANLNLNPYSIDHPDRYKAIRKNKWHSSGNQDAFERCGRDSLPQVCACPVEDDDGAGRCSGSYCSNRDRFQSECPPECKDADGKPCGNQVVGRNRKMKVAKFKTKDGRGRGLKAREDIQENQSIMEFQGEVVSHEERLRRQSIVPHQYAMGYFQGRDLDVYEFGNDARFINHSCNPNTKASGVQVRDEKRMAVIATRDIKKGEELTLDYGNTYNLPYCRCGEENCRDRDTESPPPPPPPQERDDEQ